MFISCLFFIPLFPQIILSTCDNCAICDENEQCSECLPGFGFFYWEEANKCSKCDASCKHCRDYSRLDCTDCYDGFYLYDGQCNECKSELCSRCTYQSNSYKCLDCIEGYFLDGGNCQQCYQTCKTCTGTGESQCLTCKDGFFDSSSGQSEEHSCVTCAPLCKKCHGANIQDCEQCDDGYFFTENECRLCDPNCKTCETKRTNCLTCHDGYYPDENHVCQPCFDHCKKCTGPQDNQCTDCFEGYVEVDGYCHDCKTKTDYGCSKCKKKNGRVICTQCPPGYKTVEYDGDVESAECERCIINDCYSCQISPYSCTVCNDNFYLASSTSCQKCEYPCINCVDSATKCTSCHEHYHYDKASNSCQECPENCLECDSNLICTKCNATYYLNDKQICTRCDKSCYLCKDETNACEECAIGYHFNEVKRCVPCPEHCDICDSTQCIVCSADFYEVDGICTPCADVCAHCNGPTEDDCISCDDGFYYSEYLKACFPCHQSCSACNGPANYQCSSCAIGYFLNEQECSKCEFNCKNCESMVNCLECEDGFRLYIRDGESDHDCQPCRNRGCKKCEQSIDQCTECIDGFYPSPTGKENFVDCIKCPPDCKSCSSNDKGQIRCNDCNDGYYVDNGICNKCNSPCATCSTKDQCLTCANGYLFDGVSKCSSQCSAECLTCEQKPDKCTSCPDGYTLSGTKCIQCTEGCRVCDYQWGEYVCTSCLDGYFLEFDKMTRVQKCTKCNQECSTCSSGAELGCLSCAAGYYFTKMNTDIYHPFLGKCESCSKDNSHCQLCIENCNDDDKFNCEPTPICTKCVDGYYIDYDNVCQACDKSCASCNGPSIYDCVVCADGLLRQDDVCVGCDDSCLTCDGVPNNCTSCVPGKYVKDGTCNSCNLENCLECTNSPDYCTKCPSGKYLYESKCYSSCTEAGFGLGLDETTNECYKCNEIANCIEYDLSCKCSSCKEGFLHYVDPVTSVEICSECKLENCAVCTGLEINDCTECKTGFYMHNNENTKECKQCQEPCVKCSGEDGSICNECEIGYELTDSKCVLIPDICEEGKHCDKDNKDGNDYVNYTTHYPSYDRLSFDNGGGAIRVLNGGFIAKKCNFTNCISNSGGGGGIYIYNNIPNAQSTYSINIKSMVFETCQAQFGAAVFIYSPSEKSPVLIDSCTFNGNILLGSGSGKLTGGSAVYIVSNNCEIVSSSFSKNKGKGGSVKISDEFDNLPEGLRILHMNVLNNTSASFKISDCKFDSGEDSDCSLFYSSKLKSSQVIINDCTFTGNLAKGSHFIDGKIMHNEIPGLYINSCKFSANEKQSFNTKFIKVRYQSSNSFAKNHSNSYKSWYVIATTLVSAAIIAAIFVVRKFKNTNDELLNSQKSMEA